MAKGKPTVVVNSIGGEKATLVGLERKEQQKKGAGLRKEKN